MHMFTGIPTGIAAHPNPAAGSVKGSDVLQIIQQRMERAGAALLNKTSCFARGVPACSGNLLELHLDKKDNCIDFAWRLNKYFDRPLLNREWVPAACYPVMDKAGNGFAWGMENVWIEHDHPFDGRPALFFDLHRDKPFLPEEVYSSLQQLTSDLDTGLHPALLPFLARIKALGLYAVYYGFMFSRKSDYTRLTIHGVKHNKLAEILAVLGWAGSYDAIRELQAAYLHDMQELVLAVDFGEHLSVRIGIEVFEENKHAMQLLLRMSNLLSQEHGALLQTWPGTIQLPPELSQSLSQLHRRHVARLYKRISHFKFIVTAREQITAKAYLYYCF